MWLDGHGPNVLFLCGASNSLPRERLAEYIRSAAKAIFVSPHRFQNVVSDAGELWMIQPRHPFRVDVNPAGRQCALRLLRLRLRKLSRASGRRYTSHLHFFEQELARFSNDQRFVYYEHVVAGVMQFDDLANSSRLSENTGLRLLSTLRAIRCFDVAIVIIRFLPTNDTNHSKGFF